MDNHKTIYCITLVHCARTWERLRLEQPLQEMPLDNIASAEELLNIADAVFKNETIQKFLSTMDGSVWDEFGDGCSDSFIERVCKDYITKNYLMSNV